MVRATHAIKIKQMAKLVQRELGILFLMETTRLFGGAVISVTTVDLSSDLSLAKVYLSFSLHEEQATLLQKIDGHKSTMRRLLGKRVAGKMHKIPNLKFMIDRSVMQGARVTALIDALEAD
ncbi:MAG: 30S ribosome-binding factor RbfA [Candidatus Cardinium sp.]|uniref:30S ribosome-binding factor RbfA n=1 Tax=Candidatus Cardinium sp. TP TaxID=2961955 RepID=UPI0021AE71D2|nr:30S ribosome-binding factor RbfA [Candidatus Cardinium sp. TP]MCT4697115.1 30S ribosome-binding factor RbfA [Candidatus Cardinium sp. TP]MDN5247108.1 30S ribosome-binding factor RbfA [Candidatus Cardinium sp.]